MNALSLGFSFCILSIVASTTSKHEISREAMSLERCFIVRLLILTNDLFKKNQPRITIYKAYKETMVIILLVVILFLSLGFQRCSLVTTRAINHASCSRPLLINSCHDFLKF